MSIFFLLHFLFWLNLLPTFTSYVLFFVFFYCIYKSEHLGIFCFIYSWLTWKLYSVPYSIFSLSTFSPQIIVSYIVDLQWKIKQTPDRDKDRTLRNICLDYSFFFQANSYEKVSNALDFSVFLVIIKFVRVRLHKYVTRDVFALF